MNKRINIFVCLALALALGLICTVRGEASKEKKESKETTEKVALADVPAAVKAALEKEAGGAAISEIEKVTKDGKTVYEAEFTKDGKKMETTVDDTGKVVKPAAEDKEDADDEDDDDSGDDDDDKE